MMKEVTTKALAEAALRQLPAVIGASVREDIYGHPREVHLLVAPGPNPRELARTVRKLLQERLGIEIDQRVISIAQLARQLDSPAADGAPAVEAVPTAETAAHPPANPAPTALAHAGEGEIDVAPAAAVAGTTQTQNDPERYTGMARIIYQGVESTSRDGKISVHVHVSWQGREFTGKGEELIGGSGRVRAAASATLDAAMQASGARLRLDLESASNVRALGREYVIVTVRATAAHLGRKPVTLVGAQPIEFDAETATALATLHALNRVLAPLLE